MKKYYIIENDYEYTKEIKKILISSLDSKNWLLEKKKPDFVFVIGGDGTFLEAKHLYQDQIENIIFVPIKSGGIGFYTHFNLIENIENVNIFLSNEFNKINLELLEINFNGKIHFALNELKIANNVKAIFADIRIDDIFFQRYHGGGIVFATSTGSSGYIKSINGSVILPKNSGIWEYHEITPVSTSNYRSLNSGLVLTKENKFDLNLDIQRDLDVVIDGFKIKIDMSNINVKLSDKKIKIGLFSDYNISPVELIKYIFTKERGY